MNNLRYVKYTIFFSKSLHNIVGFKGKIVYYGAI